ncbi:MAG: hypothetical protein HRT58_03365 [Crocinitomicaceae bacterium]|nr:hypothetical protein [Flavobacteriales bacterium]NQZ34671.1 hypothetical protein [Crocinitomicaceae bacterium]
MKITISILLCVLSYSCIAQNDSINQHNLKGKKHGVWIVYLDSLLSPVDSIYQAYFTGYESYDNGDRIFKYYEGQNSDADSVSYNFVRPVKGSPELINGVFKWFTSDGRILEHEEYENGWPKYYKSYQYYAKDIQKCGFNEVLDWTKKYNGIEGSYYYEELLGDKVAMTGWFRKGKRGWRVYKIKE